MRAALDRWGREIITALGKMAHKVGAGQDAPDLVSMALLKLLGSKADMHTERQLTSYAISTLLNEWATMCKTRRNDLSLDWQDGDGVSRVDTVPSDGRSDPEAIAISYSEAARYAHVLIHLPDPYRAAILLRVAGLSCREIAAHEGIPSATVRTRIFKGRKIARERLAREEAC